jgi:hypothetical protein
MEAMNVCNLCIKLEMSIYSNDISEGLGLAKDRNYSLLAFPAFLCEVESPPGE